MNSSPVRNFIMETYLRMNEHKRLSVNTDNHVSNKQSNNSKISKKANFKICLNILYVYVSSIGFVS